MKGKLLNITASISFLFCVLLASSAAAAGYTLTVSADGSGIVTRNPTNSIYPPGVTVTVTAIPDVGWYFDSWSGDASGTNNPLNVMMNTNLAITGHFLALPKYTLTLSTNGQGTIVLNPPGGSYVNNTLVTATATPAAGWVFDSWSGDVSTTQNPLSLTVNTNLSLIGTFGQLPAFDVQPVSVTNALGSTVAFSAHAVGSTPLAMQWYFSGGSLTGASNSTLTLTNVSSGQAGNYWVVATNRYGSATSSIVSLTLTNSTTATHVVNSPDDASLRAAIALGGWIGFGFSGTVLLTNTIPITTNVFLDGSGAGVTISGGNAVRLFSVAPGITFGVTNLTLANGTCLVTNNQVGVTADGGGVYNTGGSITLMGCTLTNNSALCRAAGGVARGGSIFSDGGTVSLFQTSVSNNLAIAGGVFQPQGVFCTNLAFGGAIYSTNAVLTITRCVISSNVCQALISDFESGLNMGGAAFQASGSVTIEDSLLVLNQALGGPPNSGYLAGPPPAYGGALAAIAGSLIIKHSQFIGNKAQGGDGPHSPPAAPGPAFGGALYSAGSLAAMDSSFIANQALAGGGRGDIQAGYAAAKGYGGAIYNSGTAAINGCSVCSNVVQGGVGQSSIYPGTGGDGSGGGVFNAARLGATNCTLALNSAIGGAGASSAISGKLGTAGNAFGGGVFNNTNATFASMNLTIACNTCSSPSYILANYGYTNGTATGFQIANTNGTLRLHNSLIAYSGTNANAYGTITDDGYNISSDGSAQLFGGASYNFTDPKLGPLGAYGGPTLCMALLAGSPTIDTGDPAHSPDTDQRGFIRPVGAGPDMGAYEFGSYQQTIHVVNSPDDASLRAAIAQGGWIGFGFSGTVTLTNTIPITTTVFLDGSGVAVTISGGNAVRLFSVAPGVTFGVTNLALANGTCLVTTNQALIPADGGAIYNTGGNVTLVSCTLTNNNALGTPFGGVARGGAIFSDGGTVSLFQTSVSNNQALAGGQFTPNLTAFTNMACGGAIYSTNAAITITECVISSNLCQALWQTQGILGQDQEPSGLITMGGAVFQASGSVTIERTAFVSNQALGSQGGVLYTEARARPAHGGALAATAGSVAISDSQFLANTAQGGTSTYHQGGGGGFAYGGAVYSAATLVVRDTALVGNQAMGGFSGVPGDGYGGAIYNSGMAVLNGCAVYSNTASGAVGRTSGMSSPGAGGAASGGAIFNAAQLGATNCTLALNSASGGPGASVGPFPPGMGPGGNAFGGGVFNSTNATFAAMNLTVASNACNSPSDSGLAGLVTGFQIANTNGTLRLHNSLIAYSGTNANAYGTITDDGYNISSDGSAQLYGGSSYNFTDPQLGPLGDYGGPTLCMALLAGSPAIDTGDPAHSPSTDQRGFIRPVGAGPDIGAYEFGSGQPGLPHLSITLTATNVLISFLASPSNLYCLQASTNMSAWTELCTNGPFTSPTTVTQPVSMQGISARWFRLRME